LLFRFYTAYAGGALDPCHGSRNRFAEAGDQLGRVAMPARCSLLAVNDFPGNQDDYLAFTFCRIAAGCAQATEAHAMPAA
jgi:hypothetical protein